MAIESTGQRLSYRQLANEVGLLAVQLQRQGVGANVPVLVCLPASADLVVAMLAIWQCGAVYIPVDIGQPQQRIISIIDRAKPALAIINQHTRTPAVSALAQLNLSDLAADVAEPLPLGRCQGVAYELFTSGTTGEPKGVVIEHGALQAFMFAAKAKLDIPGVAPNEIAALSVTTPTFDISLLEYLLPLVCGGRLIVADDDQRKDGQALAELITQQQINWLQMTPTGWSVLLASGWQGNAGLTALSGGEPLNTALAERLLDGCQRVFNCYGPTEATIWSMMGELKADADNSVLYLTGPLGQSGHLVLDSQKQRVPPGGCGELWITGASLAQGYLDDPQQTQSRFCQIQGHDGQWLRAYCTGDRVQLKNDHQLAFLGRSDQQIKLQGYRIELEEIEQVIARAPAVKGAACKVVDGDNDQPWLAAYVVADNDDAISQAKALVQNTLPGYMHPRVWLSIEALPTHVSGKVNRAALVDPQLASHEYVAPQSELQALLQDLWQQVFERDNISVDAGFFALGGNSLIATRLSVAVKQALDGMTLDIRQLLGGASIIEIAGASEQAYLINKNRAVADQQMEEVEW
jgi:amino acid adenylation domain-containing protein